NAETTEITEFVVLVFLCGLCGPCVVRRDQKRPQGAEGLSPMADACLAIAGFGQGAAEGRVIEDRVVAETAGPLWLGRNPAFDDAAGLEQDLRVFRQRQGAHEPSRAGFDAPCVEPAIYKVELVGVRRVGTAKTRGFDARSAAERVDFQARVLRHRQLTGA